MKMVDKMAISLDLNTCWYMFVVFILCCKFVELSVISPHLYVIIFDTEEQFKCHITNLDKRPSLVQGLAKRTFSSFKKGYCEEIECAKLEQEIKQENQISQHKLGRVRHKGELILHSKAVLMLIVVLNLVDCILVLSELILDIHYVKELIDTSDMQSQDFINKMEARYPEQLYNNDIDHIDNFYNKVVTASCEWKDYTTTLPTKTIIVKRDVFGIPNDGIDDADATHTRKMREGTDSKESATDDSQLHKTNVRKKQVKPHSHSIWEEIAHGMHKASIAILAVLFVENLFKIFFMGRRFFQHKLEVFDAVVVIVSFAVDLVFIKGLTEYRIQDGIFILSFLLPWRVIRVVNSLIVAVLDHEHFRLKMMYKKHKTSSTELKAIKKREKQFELHLKKIETFLLSEGMLQCQINKHIGLNYKYVGFHVAEINSHAVGNIEAFRNDHSTITSMLSYALSGVKVTGTVDTSSVCSSLNRSLNDIYRIDVTNDNKDDDSLNDAIVGSKERMSEDEVKPGSVTDSDSEVDVSAMKFTENAPDYDTFECNNVTNVDETKDSKNNQRSPNSLNKGIILENSKSNDNSTCQSDIRPQVEDAMGELTSVNDNSKDNDVVHNKSTPININNNNVIGKQ